MSWPSGHYYIGKSANIPQRWQQHLKNFADGKHSKLTQQVYNQHGTPEFSVLYHCHKDHIDLVEGMYIGENYDDPMCLNAAKGALVSQEDCKTLLDAGNALQFSTAEHIRGISFYQSKVSELQDQVDELHNTGIRPPHWYKQTTDELRYYQDQYKLLNRRVEQYNRRGLLYRLFHKV